MFKISSLLNNPSVILGRVDNMAMIMVARLAVRKMMTGMVRYGASDSLSTNSDNMTPIIIEFTDIRIFAFLSAISLR